MLKFIATSSIDGISYSSLSRNIGITKHMAVKYVNLLEKSFVLEVIQPIGRNINKEPKILFSLPFRFVFEDKIPNTWLEGAKREEFFVSNLKRLNLSYHYLKSKRGKKLPDYYVEIDQNKYIFEVGGKGKNLSQFKFAQRADCQKFVLSIPGKVNNNFIPLILWGFIN